MLLSHYYFSTSVTFFLSFLIIFSVMVNSGSVLSSALFFLHIIDLLSSTFNYINTPCQPPFCDTPIISNKRTPCQQQSSTRLAFMHLHLPCSRLLCLELPRHSIKAILRGPPLRAQPHRGLSNDKLFDQIPLDSLSITQ